MQAAPPRFVEPMLPAPADRIPGGRWSYERKFDGYRVVAVTGSTTRLYSRRGTQVGSRFAPLVADLPRRPAVLDGEVVGFRDGREHFGAVQRGDASHLVLFDVMNLDGHDVTRLPLATRRQLLETLALGPRAIRSPTVTGDPQRMHSGACAAGWEGLVAKRADSAYRSGRTRTWLKLKCIEGQEFVVVGHTPGGHGGLGALLLGYHEDGALRFAGKVGTGFDAATARRLLSRLAPLSRPTPPLDEDPGPDGRAATWVEPVLVARVDFAQWTRDGRLRQPRFIALRDDKPAKDVVREVPVRGAA